MQQAAGEEPATTKGILRPEAYPLRRDQSDRFGPISPRGFAGEQQTPEDAVVTAVAAINSQLNAPLQVQPRPTSPKSRSTPQSPRSAAERSAALARLTAFFPPVTPRGVESDVGRAAAGAGGCSSFQSKHSEQDGAGPRNYQSNLKVDSNVHPHGGGVAGYIGEKGSSDLENRLWYFECM